MMNRNICIIPCFSRPEFLTICLERIMCADYWIENDYFFAVDWGYNTEITKIIESFPTKRKSVRLMNRTSFGTTKQSLNLLSAYKEAHEKTSGLIFMIEEDVMIAKNFFEWHRLVHESEQDLFCSIATRNNNRKVNTLENESAYYKTSDDYQSLGVCFKSVVIEKIVPHINRDYLTSPVSYCKKKFPNNTFGEAFAEQDGLIRRIQQKEANSGGMQIAFPHVPKAFHAGFYGKNRGQRISGTLEERTNKIRSIIFDDEMMRTVNKGSVHLYEDSIPVNLETERIENVTLIQPTIT